MARKTVISKLIPEETQDGVIGFPQNRTLYVDKFTDEGPLSDEDRKGFQAKNIAQAFSHYNPSKIIEITTQEGISTDEKFEFKNIDDFSDNRLIDQSETLHDTKAQVDAYSSVINKLEKNKTLRSALNDEASRNELQNALEALLEEIRNAE